MNFWRFYCLTAAFAASALSLGAQINPTGTDNPADWYQEYGTYSNGGGWTKTFYRYRNDTGAAVDVRIAAGRQWQETDWYEYIHDVQPGDMFWLMVEYSDDPNGNGNGYYEWRGIDSYTILDTPTPSASAQPVTFTFGPDSFVFSHGAQGPSIAASPAGATYNIAGTASATDAGTYTFTVTAYGDYAGSASLTWTIQPEPVTFHFDQLAQVYDGTAKTATVTPSDPEATYTANLNGGPDAGSYSVEATANGNYSGSGSDTLTIAPEAVSFTFSDLARFYDGTAKSAAVVPSDANATYTADLAKGPEAGSYPVSATAYGNYSGSGSDTLTIAPKAISFTFSNLTQLYDGTVKSAVVVPSDASATYTADLAKGPEAGSYPVSATAYGNYTGLGSDTLRIQALVSASINVSPESCVAPGTVVVTWTSTDASAVTVSGPGLYSTAAVGNQALGGLSPGTYVYTIEAQGALGVVTQAAETAVTAPTRTVAIAVSPIGTGSVSGMGSYVESSSATLTATADATHVFTGWSGDVTSGDNPFTFVVGPQDYVITANFSPRIVPAIVRYNSPSRTLIDQPAINSGAPLIIQNRRLP